MQIINETDTVESLYVVTIKQIEREIEEMTSLSISPKHTMGGITHIMDQYYKHKEKLVVK